MLVNLSDVLTSEGMEMAREISLEMTCYDNGTESFEIASKSPRSEEHTSELQSQR